MPSSFDVGPQRLENRLEEIPRGPVVGEFMLDELERREGVLLGVDRRATKALLSAAKRVVCDPVKLRIGRDGSRLKAEHSLR
jgi:hypothetical protein